jgi:uncharacterized protein (TIGR04255 family)
MPFPDSPRLLFGKNPLEEVVCQVRFPPILRIEADATAIAAFQESVRQVFPLYRRTVMPIPMGLNLPAPVLQAMGGGAASSAHEFWSADETWQVSLTRDFLALTTRRYTQWADFKARLQVPLGALLAVFAPTFFQRVGLRYRDRIDRARLGLEEEWPALLRPEVLGELADETIGPHVELAARELTIRLSDDGGRVRVVHGLQREEPPGRSAYVIDSDFFVEPHAEIGAVIHVLDGFNLRAGRLFRWCITPRLRDAMEPVPG